MSKLNHQINEEIRDKEVRLLGEDGEQLGVMPVSQALDMAYAKDLDLVKIAPKAQPPACKIMDYGKFKFEQNKRDKEAKKNQHAVEVKEIRMSPGIDTHDFEVKLRNTQKFLGEGNRVKISVRFKGRAIAHPSIGEKLLLRFAEACEETANMDKAPKLEGRSMAMFLSPKPVKPVK